MAGITGAHLNWTSVAGALARGQYRAVAQVRWRMLVNSLRSHRGQFELGARIFGLGWFLLIWLGASIGIGFLSWHSVTAQHFAVLGLLLWPLLVVWQMVPVMLATFQGGVDLSVLLRFPVSFGSFCLLYIFFGLFDLSSLMGCMALLAMWIGIVIAEPRLVVWVSIALAMFAAFNFFLTRMIFAWIERWLAQRRTREILGVVFLFFFLSLQLLNPAYRRHSGHVSSGTNAAMLTTWRRVEPMLRRLPPGLAAGSLREAGQGRDLGALVPLGGLALYVFGVGALLGIRLRAEYRGESLGEAPRADRGKAAKYVRPADGAVVGSGVELSRGTGRAGGGPVWAIVEKEFHYLARSGMMLYGLLAPVFLLLIIGRNMLGNHAATLQYALPIGVAYGFLPLTKTVCNSLGGEGEGIQFYFLSPTPLRTVMLAKNVMHLGLFAFELIVACSIVVFRFGVPGREIVAATLCWVLFAIPAQLAAGNLLSIIMAYKMTLTRISRQEGATGNGLVSLLIQLLILGVGAAIFVPLKALGHVGWAAPIFLALAVVAFWAWIVTLKNVDRMAEVRREELIATIAKRD